MRRVMVLMLVVSLLAALMGCGRTRPRPARTPPGEVEAPKPIVIQGQTLTGSPEDQAKQVVEAVTSSLRSGPGDARDRYGEALELAEQDLASVIELVPGYAPAYRALGEVLTEEAHYPESAEAFRKALALDPRHTEARSGMERAERLAKVLQALPLELGPGERVARLVEMPGPRSLVFALTGQVDEYGDISTPRVSLFRKSGESYRRVRSLSLPTWQQDDYPLRPQLSVARIYVGDFQRTGRPQVLLATGTARYSFLDIYEPEQQRLREVLHTYSYYPFEISDLNGDGRPEIEVAWKVGVTPPGAGMGLWHEVYQYRGGRYLRANAHFPKLAREQFQEMVWKNREYSDDWELLHFLGQAYRDLGQPKQAASCERRSQELKAREQTQ